MKIKYFNLCFIALLFLLNFLYFTPSIAQSNHTKKAKKLLRALIEIEQISDKNLQQIKVDELWYKLISSNSIPYISGKSIVFLFKGNYNSVHFVGDMTSWQIDEKFKAKRLEDSDLWYLKSSFPKNARLDYKIVLNEQEWVLDPNNSQIQYSGFGANSAFSMPNYMKSEFIVNQENVSKGEILELQIYSEILKRMVLFFVYKPATYNLSTNFPTIYVTDGQEYIDARTGAMPIIIDNLIFQEKIKPIVAVFVSPINPETNENERHKLFINSIEYAQFFQNELIPYIQNHFNVSVKASERAILGTSYGGNNSCWFAYKIPQTFKLIAAQSPSFPTNIDSLLANSQSLEVDKFYISTGVINDTENYADKLAIILKNKKIDYKYTKVNESHSWGNWSALIDDILLFFFEKK